MRQGQERVREGPCPRNNRAAVFWVVAGTPGQVMQAY